MHFQPLENIAENLEESGNHHPNMALFNRLLNTAPSPTGLMGGALRRTSAHLMRFRRSPSIDPPSSIDDNDDDDSVGGGGGGKVGAGVSLPSVLGHDTQSTLCSYGGGITSRTPLLEIQFGVERNRQGGSLTSQMEDEGEGEGRSGGEEEGADEGVRGSSVPLLPPPLQPSREAPVRQPPEEPPRPASATPSTARSSSVLPRSRPAHSTQDLLSTRPIGEQNRGTPAVLKRSVGGAQMSLLTVPLDVPQRLRSVSMGSEFTGS